MGNEASTGGGVFGEDGAGLQSPSARAIDSDVRRRLARGVQYNMKIVIRGDRNTGKTQLWRRLQGQHFTAAYTPTGQIQIATINWNYKVSSDVVKLDAWDVVDRAPKRKKTGAGMTDSGLKIANTQAYDASELNGDDDDDDDDDDGENESSSNARKNEFGIGSVVPLSPGAGAGASATPRSGSFAVGALDATVVDVMRGATGCIMMFDMTKKWTWEYITRELPKVARKDIEVLVVGNFRDMGESGRVVPEATAKQFCALAGDNVHYLEASMKNGYGVRAIANFFSLPFLALQKKYIDEQLRRNREETDAALHEIRALTEELTYDMYLKQLADRKAATVTSPPPASATPPATPPVKQQQQQQQQLPTAVDAATQKRIEQEEKARAKREAQEAKARQEEEARRRKAEEKRQKEEQRQKDAYNRAHAKELEQQRQAQAAEDAAAAAELKRLAAEMKARQQQQQQQQGGTGTGTGAAPASSLASVDDFKIAGADDDGWLTKAAGAGATDDDGWLVTPEGRETGQADPFAFGADDNDDGAFGGTLGGDGGDDDEVPATPVKGKGKKGKKGAHRQAFLADADDL